VEAILLACVGLPFLDRSPGRTVRERRGALLAGLVVLILWITFSVIGYRMEAGR
jgi:quinol-cytochrome oxidoreductase complex cytochrome b subunit